MIRVGERLKEERKRKGYSIEEVAKATKIRPSFLQAIEEGSYEKLPGSNYAHGFVKNYIEFCGLPVKEYMALFRREYDEKEQRRLLPESFVGKQAISLRKFSINQAILLFFGFIVLVAAYVIFQYKAAFTNPQLQVTSPLEGATISSQNVLVRGSTDTNTVVTVNTLPAYIDVSGKFNKEIPVFSGRVTVTIKAINSFGKETTVVRHILVTVGQ